MPTPKISDLKALVVDDHPIVRKQVNQMLNNLGVSQVDMAARADEAAEKMTAGAYDVIFLDWHMPGKSGYALMRQFREDRAFDRLSFVIVSMESSERSIAEANKAGALAYIIKPVTEEALESAVKSVLTRLEQLGPKKA